MRSAWRIPVRGGVRLRHKFTVSAAEHAGTGESHMRMLMLTASTIAAIAGTALSPAQVLAADIYPPSPSYGPPQAYGPPPPPPYGQPPVVAYGPPPAPQAYVVPGYPPGSEYEQPVYVEGRPYYRECWWDWGRRRCELRAWR
jgi:hypothetical protein